MSQELFERLAGQIGRHIPSKYNAVEVIACSAETAANMAGGDGNFIAQAIWNQAVAVFLNKLPSNELEAERVIKATAAQVLNDPFILENFEKREAARLRIEEAEAEIDAAESERLHRLQRVHAIRRKIKDLTDERDRWDVDWLAIGLNCEALIAENFGKVLMTAYDKSVIQDAWSNYQSAPLLAKLAPERMKLLGDKIASLEAELKELTPKPAPADPTKPFRGVIKTRHNVEAAVA